MSILTYNGNNFEQRDNDGFVNLTQMAKAAGKKIGDWTRLEKTKAYISVVSTDTGIPVSQLLYIVKGNFQEESQGTWSHPLVALHFAQWISPKFHYWCNQHIKILIEKGSTSLDGAKKLTKLEILEMALASEKARLKAEADLKLAQQTVEVLEEAVEEQAEIIDELFDYSSILRIAKYNGCSEKAFKWQVLKAASKSMGLEIKKAPCPRFGTKNLYAHDAWRLAYPDYALPETTTLRIDS